jgi:hypothetical protein
MRAIHGVTRKSLYLVGVSHQTATHVHPSILARISEAGYDDVAVLLRPKGYWLTRGNIPWSRTRYHFFESTTFVATSRPLTDRGWFALYLFLRIRAHVVIHSVGGTQGRRAG